MIMFSNNFYPINVYNIPILIFPGAHNPASPILSHVSQIRTIVRFYACLRSGAPSVFRKQSVVKSLLLQEANTIKILLKTFCFCTRRSSPVSAVNYRSVSQIRAVYLTYVCKPLGSERLHDVTSHVKFRLNLAPYADVNVEASISRRN